MKWFIPPIPQQFARDYILKNIYKSIPCHFLNPFLNIFNVVEYQIVLLVPVFIAIHICSLTSLSFFLTLSWL